MFKIIVDIWHIPELRRRILWTLGLIVVFRIGFWIYLPGIDVEAYTVSTASKSQGPLDFLLVTSRLTGGSFSPVLFSLGIMPYISASIIFSLLVKVFPRLEALSKEGEQGRRVISRYTRYATVVLCLVQGSFLVGSWGVSGTDSAPISPDAGFVMGTLQLLCLTAGSLFLMWLGEKITEVGIGNGASLIIMAGIISDIPAALGILIKRIWLATPDDRPFEITYGLMMFLLFFAVVAAVVFITKGQRRIPIQQQRAVKGRKVYGGQRHYMPIKVNAAGVLPIIFASSLIMIPTLLLSNIAFGGDSWFHGVMKFFANAFAYQQFLNTFANIAMIFFFTFFWTSLMFNPVEIAGNLKEYGNFIPGIRPGKRTAEYLDKILKRLTLAGATFLSLIWIVPQFVGSAVPGMGQLVTQFLGGTSILIVVGVALDLVEKIEAQLLMRQYEGFIRGSEGPRRGGGPEKRDKTRV